MTDQRDRRLLEMKTSAIQIKLNLSVFAILFLCRLEQIPIQIAMMKARKSRDQQTKFVYLLLLIACPFFPHVNSYI